MTGVVNPACLRRFQSGMQCHERTSRRSGSLAVLQWSGMKTAGIGIRRQPFRQQSTVLKRRHSPLAHITERQNYRLSLVLASFAAVQLAVSAPGKPPARFNKARLFAAPPSRKNYATVKTLDAIGRGRINKCPNWIGKNHIG